MADTIVESTPTAPVAAQAPAPDRTAPQQTGSQLPQGARPEHRWWVLAVLALSQLMVVLDATIVNIALPTAQRDLGFASDSRQWIVTAYSLAFGGLLLLGGRLSDLFGRKVTYITGLVGFAAASALGGAAQNFGMLVTSRAIQGVFAALLAPAALSLLSTTFTGGKERARAFGVFGAVAGSGGAVGLLLGGLLTEYWSWRWCLFVNLAFAALAIVGALVFFGRQGPAGTRPKLDLPGTLVVSLGLVGIVYAFSSAETDGWSDPRTLVTLIGGVVLLAVFVILETRVTHPLLPLRVVLDRNRGGSYLAVALTGAGLFGVFLFLAFYLQTLRGFTPLQTGIGFLPMPITIALTSTLIAPNLLPRVGPKPMIVVGAVLGAIGLLLLSRVSLTSEYWTTIPPALVVLGLGMGLVFASAFNTATAGIERRDAGVGSAMVNTSQQVGGSIGTAVLSTLAAAAVTRYSDTHGPATRQVMALAQLDSYHMLFLTSSGIFGAIAVIALVVLKWGRPAPTRNGEH
ncbi:MFS transporter [uncultured Amnibacterium sp.]|uniref:MFS transporter n=1 Tax=uncultured Amnibacterium sp. TaxID=1631851 RepID=UPI0035CA9811